MKIQFIALVSLMVLFSCKNEVKKEAETPEIETEEVVKTTEPFQILPISHATMVLQWDGTTMYVDPVGGYETFSDYESPDIILVTDIHGDHLNAETIDAVIKESTKLIVPKAVADKLPENLKSKATILNNSETKTVLGFAIEGIPMYNLRKEALKFHEKGRGNGYVIEKDNKRVYISGDTEDIPEMRSLQNIDIAFVCMNLPYTMTVQSAASAVLDFKPKVVYPYHYRGTEGFSDVMEFKKMVTDKNPNITVVQLEWYPETEE